MAMIMTMITPSTTNSGSQRNVSILLLMLALAMIGLTEGFSTIPRTPTWSTTTTTTTTTTSRLFQKSSKDDSKTNSNSDELMEKAAALRKEVEEFEALKQQETQKLSEQAEQAQKEKEELRLRYSAVVPILKPDGSISMERCDFSPRMVDTSDSDDNDNDENKDKEKEETPKPISRILAVQAPLPLGIVLGQEDPVPGFRMPPITVDDLAEGGNGANAGIRIGDLLRACTACQVTMEQPTWQLIAGGIGRPKTTRMMSSTDDKPFEEVMDIVASNAMDPEAREVWLVVERRDDDDDEDAPAATE